MTGKHAAVAQLAALVTESTGNLVPPPRLGFLAEVAQRRAQALGLATIAEYVRALAAGELPREWQSLVPLITVKESYFFRAPQQFEAIERQLLPRLLRARAASRRLRIWSAACARGEEPATLAMLLADEPALAGWEWSILATDLDEEALAGARRGLYGERAVAPVPPALLARWFNRRGKLFELAPELRSRIDYRTLNLAQPPFALPADEYDLVLLRNVLIYFGRPLQSWVMAHVTQLLSRRGALFLGASETLWQIQDELEAVDLGACYCYRHRRARPGAAQVAPAPVSRARVPAAGDPAPRAAAPRRSAPAVTAAAAASATAGSAGSAAPTASAAAGDAGAKLPRNALEILLAAAHELAANRPGAARLAVDEALAADPSEPAGHLLDGFLHDVGGRAEEAAASYRAALYLDPSLFQARLLLADCLLRLEQRGRAEHQYREVLAALEAGRERPVGLFDGLPLPDRERALRRCRQVLQRS
ncbi:MAG TPA: CheR family methyltransferase [Thermoanaerobaculia bacterium]|nr:CheR family methyltransferase [Thermoanaerobaculia bacterium]